MPQMINFLPGATNFLPDDKIAKSTIPQIHREGKSSLWFIPELKIMKNIMGILNQFNYFFREVGGQVNLIW